MTKTEAKKLIKEYGLYTAIIELRKHDYDETGNLQEIIFRVLDNIPTDILDKAENRGAR